MSIVNLYSIFDVKSSVYGPCMSFVNDNTAIRSFMEMVIQPDKNSLLALYPSDYILYCLGRFDNSNGVIEAVPAPALIITGTEAYTKGFDEAKRRAERIRQLNNLGTSDTDVISEDVNNFSE